MQAQVGILQTEFPFSCIIALILFWAARKLNAFQLLQDFEI